MLHQNKDTISKTMTKFAVKNKKYERYLRHPQSHRPFFAGNAVDPERECGGSSGGEGSLIGSGGKFLYPKYYKHGLYLLWQTQP